MKKTLRACLISVIAFSGSALADKVQVAVAANFTAPMKAIVANFEAISGHQVELSFGATGKFYAQIQNGAPFEILLAADDATPARLEQEGLAVAGSGFTYAVGKLVLWSAKPGWMDDQGDVLKQGQFEHLAIAAPKLAPYGAAAVAALTKLGLLAAIEPKLVQGENIAQTYQFIQSGNAELGFIALSQVYAGGKIREGSGWVVRPELYPVIRQNAILLAKGQERVAARALLSYLRSGPAQEVIRSFGYDL